VYLLNTHFISWLTLALDCVKVTYVLQIKIYIE